MTFNTMMIRSWLEAYVEEMGPRWYNFLLVSKDRKHQVEMAKIILERLREEEERNLPTREEIERGIFFNNVGDNVIPEDAAKVCLDIYANAMCYARRLQDLAKNEPVKHDKDKHITATFEDGTIMVFSKETKLPIYAKYAEGDSLNCDK